MALQCDLEEEPQGRGSDVGGRYRRPDRRQPQLTAVDILGRSLVGRPAQKVGKLFDVANILVLSPGLSRRIAMSSISCRRNGLMALSVIGGSCLE